MALTEYQKCCSHIVLALALKIFSIEHMDFDVITYKKTPHISQHVKKNPGCGKNLLTKEKLLPYQTLTNNLW